MTVLSRGPTRALSRRTLLAGVGASALAGVGVAALRGPPTGAHPGDPHDHTRRIRAATGWGDGYAGLVADHHSVAAYQLEVDGDRRVTIGRDLQVEWPTGFQPWAIAAAADRLLVTGSVASVFEVVTVDNRSDALPPELRELAGEGDPDLPDAIFDYEVWHYRPALVAVDGRRARSVDLPVPREIRWGAATGIVTGGAGTIAVAIDGCPDPDAHVITRCHLAVSVDGGVSWRERLLDRALREGYATTLAGTGTDLFAVTVSGEGRRTVRRGGLGADPSLEVAASTEHAGPVLAAVPRADGSLRTLTGSDGYDDAIVVHGLTDTWIRLTGHRARLEHA